MNDFLILQQSFDNFNRATASLKKAYDNLERKFESINRELEKKNLELGKMIAEKEDMKNYLQNILESLTTGVVVTDMAGRVQTINRCAEMFAEASEDDVRGKHITVLFDDISEDMWGDIFFSRFFKEEAGHKIRLKGRTLELFGSPVHDRNGGTIGTVFIVRDITRIEKLEDMAKRTEKFAAMGEMAANIAHEIRNPLGSIELFASLLMKDLKGKRDRERIARIVTSVKNMDNKISNFLLFTKTKLPHLERVKIHEILKETLLFTEQIASQGNISFSFNCADEESFVAGDAEMLKQVFLNLILNAFQAMPDGGHLHIETRNFDDDPTKPNITSYFEITFTDDGVGISAENLPKIFDPFYSTKEGTSGLGLAIVHNIVSMHKGAIHVENGAKGGTVVTLLFPLWENKV